MIRIATRFPMRFMHQRQGVALSRVGSVGPLVRFFRNRGCIIILYLTSTLRNESRRGPVHAKLGCFMAQVVDTYRGGECY